MRLPNHTLAMVGMGMLVELSPCFYCGPEDDHRVSTHHVVALTCSSWNGWT